MDATGTGGWVGYTLERSRAVVWRLPDGSSWEYCQVAFARRSDREPFWLYLGTLIAVEAGQPVRVTYRIEQAEDLRRSTCTAGVWLGAHPESWIEIERTADGSWQVAGPETGRAAPAVHLAGATELDLEFTPLTNTLAINRLNLAVGESGDLVAAWVRFPKLTVEPLKQRYTRLAERTYRYESPGFSADLEVDDLNLVVRYGDLWERVAVSDG